MYKHGLGVAGALLSLWLPLCAALGSGCGGGGEGSGEVADMAHAPAPPPAPDMAKAPLNCSDALLCELSCQDSLCFQGCLADASPTAKLDLLAVSYCLYGVCASGVRGAGCGSLTDAGQQCLACISLAVGDAARDGRPCHEELVNCLFD